MLEVLFHMRSVPMLYKGNQQEFLVRASHVEAGSNIYTVVLRDVGGDGKGTECLGA
jgi:hypothetical protein